MMRRFIGIRFGIGIIVGALMVGLIVPVAAQEATPAFTSEMMTMEGACPQGVTLAVLGQMISMMSMEATAEAPSMEATEEAGEMEATEEAAEMEATEEAMTGPHCLVAPLSGPVEVPPGDEDGVGVAFVTFDSSTGEVCYDVAVGNITLPATAMHIHVGEAGAAGDPVIPLDVVPDANGVAAGCTTASDMTVLEALAANPAGYYVNVHTSDFPDGAVRGQLMTLEEGQEMMESMGMSMEDMMGDMGDMGEATPEATP